MTGNEPLPVSVPLLELYLLRIEDEEALLRREFERSGKATAGGPGA